MLKIGTKRKLFSGICTAFIFANAFLTVKSDAASFYIRTVFDEGSFGMITQILKDTPKDKSESLERQNDVNFSPILNYKKVYAGPGTDSIPGSSLIANIVLGNKAEIGVEAEDDEKENNAKSTYEAFLNADEDAANKGLLFTFPGMDSTVDTSITYVGTSADAARAELVGNTLTKGLNDALAFIKTYSKSQHVGGEGLRHVVAQLARITSQFPDRTAISFNTGGAAGNKGFTVHYIDSAATNKTIGGKTIKIKEDLIPVNDLDYSDYAIISTTDGNTGKVVYGYFPWKMEKGYWENGRMADYVGDKYVKIAQGGDGAEYKENKYITWGQLAMQAGVNADLRGSTSVDADKDTMTLIGQGLGADLTSTINSVRSLLNLAPIQELILNMGSRSITHYHGVMSQDMYNTAKVVYAFILAVSLLFLGVLIVRMIHHKMISTTNIIARTSLMEGIQDIMFVGVMLAIFPGIFELLLEVNYHIVKIFSFSSSYLQAYGISGAKVLGMESLAGFMVSSIYLSIDAYINTTYLVRAIVVSFLYAISPIMTVSYAWGSMQKKLYFSYLRELVGNIFMQSFHAVTMTFFSGYNTTNLSAMEAIASAYCFIPITQLFRSLVIGSQGGFSEQLGGKLAGQLTNTATGMHRSNVAMRQSKELNNLQAENSKNSAFANMGAQMLSSTASVIGSNFQDNMNMGELATSAVRAMAGSTGGSKGGNNASGGDKKGGGFSSAVKGAGVNALMNGLAAGAGAYASGSTEQENRAKLGEMQMKHSMENMGTGLAQAGIGLGVSSYDGAGGGMVSAGMGSVEKAAGTYGQGQSNAGAGGESYGQAVRHQTFGQLGSQAMRDVNGQYAKERRNQYREYQKQQVELQKQNDARDAQMDKEKDRGLSVSPNPNGGGYEDTAKYMNFSGEIMKVEAHQDNKNNATFNVNSHSVTKENASNSFDNYINAIREHLGENGGVVDMNNPKIQEALKSASAEYGVSRTVAPTMSKDGTISVVLENLPNKLGMEVDGDGKTYASSKALRSAWEAHQSKSNGN